MNELSRVAAQGNRKAVLECCVADALFCSHAANHDNPGLAASRDTEKMIKRTRIAKYAVNLFLVNDLIRRKEILLK
jgi:hypothetical protein